MKQLRSISLIVFLSLTLLSACQSYAPEINTELDEASQSNEPADAYPIEGAPQIDLVPADSALAYPIPEEALPFLVGSWTLINKTENGVEIDNSEKVMILREDNTYEISSTEGYFTGMWTDRVNSLEALLILDSGTEAAVAYNILEITEDSLHLSYLENGIEIHEQYVPTD